MPRFARYSPAAVCLLVGAWAITAPRVSRPQVAPPPEQKTAAGAATAPATAPSEPRALYQALNALRPDPNRVYSVKALSFHRDVINLTFDEGKLAFFQPLAGRVTGAVFSGRGHAIVIPHDSGERRSLAQFVSVPILDQTFSSAYLRFDDDTAEELAVELAKAGATPAPDSEFTSSWQVAFVSPASWHSLRIMEDWLSAAPLPYFYAGIVSDAQGLIDLLVDSRRSEQVLLGQSTALGKSALYDVWASFRAADAPATALGTFVPLDYNIDTRIGPDLDLEGTTTVLLKAVRAGERIIPLELSRKLAIESIKADDGASLVYFQNEDLSKRQIQSRGNDTVLVVLPSPAREGQEIRLHVTYQGTVISDAGNGVDYVGEHETWYAHPSGVDHFAPFDLTFRWPKRLSLVATGERIDSRDDGDFQIGRWKSDVPFAVAGFNLGEYQTETAGNGHPRVELYANRELENAIVARLQREPLRIPARPAPGQFPAYPGGLGSPPPPPSPASVLKNLGSEISDSIQFFEKLNGPFPFRDLEISQIPGSVGQGWPGLVYLSTFAFLPAETEQRAGLAQLNQELAREVMPFHELAHQWWGNVAVAETYRDVWIQEGMANYLALLYADSRKPASHRMATWLERYRSQLTASEPGTGRSVEDSGPLTLGFRLASSRSPGAYETVIYGKGTWVMHMLHELLLEPSAKDPDARFRALLASILTQYRFKPFSTAEFQRAVEQQMTPAMDLEGDRSMRWFFDEWVRATGIPRYKVQFEARPRGNAFVVSGKLEQAEVNDLFTAPVPLFASRPGEKTQRLGVVVTTGPETRFHFISKFRPTRLTIDPRLTLLCRTD